MARVCLYCARFPSEPFGVAPLGIGYLASTLMHRGIVAEKDVLIADSLDEAIAFRPDILGVSSVSQVLGDARKLAAACKEATGCVTVLGGYHVTCVPQKLPEEFDVGVLSEGEVTFAELVERFEDGRLRLETLSDIRGICYRQGGEVVLTLPRGLIADVDSIPPPYRPKRYSGGEPVFTSRGCPFRCTFCASHAFWGDTVRFRSAEAVVAEIEHLVETYRPREIPILDDLWMADKPRLGKIVDGLVERGIPERIAFQGFCRSNIVHEEDILLFKKLNYRFVRFGAETGSERLLRRIKGEGISVADHQRVIDLCAKHGLRCAASFMFGIPGETTKDLKLTIDFLRRNKGKCQIRGFYLFNPMPGTALWEEMTRDGLVTDELPFERLQLDLLKPNFSWDDLLYFNAKNVPLKRFRRIIERIRKEFVDPYPPGEEADWLSGTGEHRFRGSELYVLSEAYRQGEHIVYSDALRKKTGVAPPIAAFGPYCNLRRGEYELELEMDLAPAGAFDAAPDVGVSLAAGPDARSLRRYVLSEFDRDGDRYRARFNLETDEKLFQVILTPQPGCHVTLRSLALRKIEGA